MDPIENDQRSRKIDDEQKSQKFMSQTLLERDSQMPINFDDFDFIEDDKLMQVNFYKFFNYKDYQ